MAHIYTLNGDILTEAGEAVRSLSALRLHVANILGTVSYHDFIQDREVLTPDHVISALPITAIRRFLANDVKRELLDDIEATSDDDLQELLQTFSPEALTDLDVIAEVLARDGHLLYMFPETVRHSKQTVRWALTTNGTALMHVPDELQQNPYIVALALESDGMALAYAPPSFRDSDFFVTKALRSNGNAVRFASERLQQRLDIALLACQTTAEALRYVSPELRHESLVAVAIARDGNMLRYASRELRDDKNIAKAAVANRGSAIRFVSQRLLFDEDVLISAAKQNSDSMRHVQLHLLNDSVIDAIIHANGYVARFADLDKRRAILAVQSNGLALKFIQNFSADRQVVLAALRQNGDALEYSNVPCDDEMAVAAVTSNGSAYRLLPPIQRKRRCIVDLAIRQDTLAYVYVDPDIQTLPEIVQYVLNTEPALLFENPVLHNDKEIVEEVLRRDGQALCQVAAPSIEMELIAVEQAPFVLQFVQHRNHQIFSVALDRDPEALQFMTEEEQAMMYGCIRDAVARCPRAIRHVEKQDARIAGVALKRDLGVLNMIDADVFDEELLQILLQSPIEQKHVECIEILAEYLPSKLSAPLWARLSAFDSPFKRARS